MVEQEGSGSYNNDSLAPTSMMPHTISKDKKLWRTKKVWNEKTRRFNKTFECKICLHLFTKVSNAQDHTRKHLGTRPYKC